MKYLRLFSSLEEAILNRIDVPALVMLFGVKSVLFVPTDVTVNKKSAVDENGLVGLKAITIVEDGVEKGFVTVDGITVTYTYNGVDYTDVDELKQAVIDSLKSTKYYDGNTSDGLFDTEDLAYANFVTETTVYDNGGTTVYGSLSAALDATTVTSKTEKTTVYTKADGTTTTNFREAVLTYISEIDVYKIKSSLSDTDGYDDFIYFKSTDDASTYLEPQRIYSGSEYYISTENIDSFKTIAEETRYKKSDNTEVSDLTEAKDSYISSKSVYHLKSTGILPDYCKDTKDEALELVETPSTIEKYVKSDGSLTDDETEAKDSFITLEVKYQHYGDTEHYYDTLEEAEYGVYGAYPGYDDTLYNTEDEAKQSYADVGEEAPTSIDIKYYFYEDENSTAYDTKDEAKSAFETYITKYLGYDDYYDTKEEAEQTYEEAGEDVPESISTKYYDGATYQLTLSDALLTYAMNSNNMIPYPVYLGYDNTVYDTEDAAKQTYEDAEEDIPDSIDPSYEGVVGEDGTRILYDTVLEAIESYIPESIGVNDDGSYTGYNNTYSTEQIAKESYAYNIINIYVYDGNYYEYKSDAESNITLETKTTYKNYGYNTYSEDEDTAKETYIEQITVYTSSFISSGGSVDTNLYSTIANAEASISGSELAITYYYYMYDSSKTLYNSKKEAILNNLIKETAYTASGYYYNYYFITDHEGDHFEFTADVIVSKAEVGDFKCGSSEEKDVTTYLGKDDVYYEAELDAKNTYITSSTGYNRKNTTNYYKTKEEAVTITTIVVYVNGSNVYYTEDSAKNAIDEDDYIKE